MIEESIVAIQHLRSADYRIGRPFIFGLAFNGFQVMHDIGQDDMELGVNICRQFAVFEDIRQLLVGLSCQLLITIG